MILVQNSGLGVRRREWNLLVFLGRADGVLYQHTHAHALTQTQWSFTLGVVVAVV